MNFRLKGHSATSSIMPNPQRLSSGDRFVEQVEPFVLDAVRGQRVTPHECYAAASACPVALSPILSFPTFKHSNLPYSRDEMQRADTCTHDRTHTHTRTRTHMYFLFLNTARATCGKSCHRYLKRQEKSQAAMMWSRWPKPCQRCTSTSTPSWRRKPGPCTGLAPCWS